VRTTLTLDDDVAAGIRREARRTGRPVKAVVNDALRAGLESRARPTPLPFRVQASDMGLLPGVVIDDVAGLLDRVEGPERR
jgi:plasmid stability protein